MANSEYESKFPSDQPHGTNHPFRPGHSWPLKFDKIQSASLNSTPPPEFISKMLHISGSNCTGLCDRMMSAVKH